MASWIGAQTRKSLADVLRRKAHSIAIVIAILIAVGGLTAVNVADNSLVSAYAFSVDQPGADRNITLTVDRSTPSLLSSIARVSNVAALQVSTIMTTQWHVAAAPGHVDFTIVGYPDPRHAPLTPFQLIAGRYARAGEIVLEYGDEALQHVSLGDLVTLDAAHGHVALRVAGFSRTPGTNPAITGKAIGYMSTAGLDRLPAYQYVPGSVQRQPLRTQEIALRLRSPADYQATVSALAPILRGHGTTVLGVFPPAHGAPVGQLRGILSLVRVLLLVALTLALILLLNSVTALVAQQTPVIGTMKALGATSARIVRGYVTTILIYCTIAAPLGIGLGILIGGRVASALETSIPIAPGPTLVSAGTLGLALGVGFAVPVLAALIPLWLTSRISVREALSAWGVASVEVRSRGPVARFASRRLARAPQTIWLGLRGLFRRPWRAALSIVTVAIAAAAFLIVQTLATSVNSSIGSVWGNFRADVEVYVGGQQSFTQITAFLRQIPNVGRIERVGWFGSQTPWGKVAVWGIEPDTRIYHPQMTGGAWFSRRASGVALISDDLAERSGLRVGSRLTLPGPGGDRTMTLSVTGTIHESVDDLTQVGAVVLPVNELYELEGARGSHIGDYTNRVLVQSVNRSAPAVDRLTRAIDNAGRQAAIDAQRDGPVAEVFTFHDEVVRHQRGFLPVDALLFAVAVLVAAVGVLGLADALAASVVDRRRDIGLLRSLGATGRRVAAVFWIEALALSATAWLVAAAAGIPLARLFIVLFRRTVMPTEFHFEPGTLALMVVSTLVVSTLAAIVPAHRAAALHPGDLLRGE
jgi:putative ABC transport system permease protein